MNLDVVAADVIGDVALVIGASWLLGAAARRIGQPTVVGQIVAGIILGPSLLGRLPGHLTNRLFTHAAIPYINVISQLAVVIFMFTVGYEIDLRSIRGHGRSAAMVAIGALLVPLALGTGIAVGARHEFSAIGEPHASGRSFVLFIAVATSITALPVLASIVRERGLAGTTVGTVATTAAGFMDVAAWLVLAVALIGTNAASHRTFLETLLLFAGFVVLMLFGVRPALKWWIRRPGAVVSNQVPVALMLAAAGAWATASLGLHPIFGAFVAGLTMPGSGDAPDADVLRIMEQAGGLLLPLFFVVTGLTMNVGALNAGDIGLLAIIVACAILGKVGAGYAMSRFSGLDVRKSATVAVLVNTRGLTELIALNVGLSSGIIHERLFTILVLMALSTTALTGPLITAIGRKYKTSPEPREQDSFTGPGALDRS